MLTPADPSSKPDPFRVVRPKPVPAPGQIWAWLYGNGEHTVTRVRGGIVYFDNGTAVTREEMAASGAWRCVAIGEAPAILEATGRPYKDLVRRCEEQVSQALLGRPVPRDTRETTVQPPRYPACIDVGLDVSSFMRAAPPTFVTIAGIRVDLNSPLDVPSGWWDAVRAQDLTIEGWVSRGTAQALGSAVRIVAGHRPATVEFSLGNRSRAVVIRSYKDAHSRELPTVLVRLEVVPLAPPPRPRAPDIAPLRALADAVVAVTGSREWRRREIDAVIADDARRFPEFATARRCATLAFYEDMSGDDPDYAPKLLGKLHAYEAARRRGMLRARATVEAFGRAESFIIGGVVDAYERARGER